MSISPSLDLQAPVRVSQVQARAEGRGVQGIVISSEEKLFRHLRVEKITTPASRSHMKHTKLNTLRTTPVLPT